MRQYDRIRMQESAELVGWLKKSCKPWNELLNGQWLGPDFSSNEDAELATVKLNRTGRGILQGILSRPQRDCISDQND